MQFVAVMQSLEGWADNLEAGISSPERAAEHLKSGLDELRELRAERLHGR